MGYYQCNDYPNSIDFGELLKFDGTNFEVILKRSPGIIYKSYNTKVNTDRFSKLSDGRIAFHKSINRQGIPEIDSIDKNFNLVIFDPKSNEYESIELKTFDWDSSYNRIVNNIYTDINNKLWFAHNGSPILVCFDPLESVLMHTGLTRYDLETKQWYIFDKKNEMPFSNDGRPRSPVNFIKRLNSQKMLMNIWKDLYTINSNDMIEKLDWSDIVPNVTIFKANEDVTDDFINQTMIEIQKEIPMATYTPQFHNTIVTEDGTVWILATKFLMKIPATVLGINEIEYQNGDFDIYPNPAGNFIQIQSKDKDYTELKITNIMGISLLTKSGITDRIDISHLPAGMYYVTIRYSNGIYKSKKFIKCD